MGGRVGKFLGFLPLLWIAPAYAQSTDIIVTGEKRPIPLEQTTTSIALLTADDTTDRSLRDLRQVYDQTANLAPVFGGSGFSIRGIANFGVTGSGEAATSTVYLDGMPLASTYLLAAPTQLWDVSQVEILRGPQSTIQGLNALAGAIVIKSAEPSFENWSGSARGILTSEPQSRLSAAAGGPISDGQLALRVSADAFSRDGYIRNITRNTAEDSEHSAVLKARLAWRPAWFDSFEARLGAIHAERKGPYFTVYARTDVPDFLNNRVATDNVANTTDLRFDGSDLTLKFTPVSGFTMLSQTTWSRARETSQFDGDYGPSNLAYSRQQRIYRTWTQELRLIADTERLKGVAGLYFYDRDLQSATLSRTSVPTPSSTIASFLRSGGASAFQATGIAQAYSAALPLVSIDFAGAFPTHVRSYSAFADARVKIIPGIHLLLGFRADREINEAQTLQQATFAGIYPDPAHFGNLGPIINQINAALGSLVAQADGNLPEVRRVFGTFLPKAGIALHLARNVEVALVFQKAYRSGGSTANIARGQVVAYDPETTWNYEASVRSLLLGGKLRLNANAFYVDWRNQQVAVNFGLNSYDVNTVNAGKSHLYGFEVEANYQLLPSLAAYFSIGHTHTKFDQFAVTAGGTTNNLSGSEFPFAPQWTVSGGANFRLSTHLDGAVDASYASRAFAASGVNQADYRIVPHTIMNGRLGYSADTWAVHVFCSNILNEQYIAYKSPTENRAGLNTPRTLGVEIAARY